MVELTLISGDDPKGALGAKRVSIDTETTGLTYTSNLYGVSMAWRDDNGNMHSCYIRNEHGQTEQLGLFDAGITIEPVDVGLFNDIMKQQVVFHNLPFDYRVLFRAFGLLDQGGRYHDTMHLARSVGYQESLSLENLYKKYVGSMSESQVSMKKKRNDLSKVSIGDLAQYAREDAETTLLLYEKLQRIAMRVLDPVVYQSDLEFTSLVMRLVSRGVAVDRDWLDDKAHSFETRMIEISKALAPLGVRNPGSDEQVRTLLFKYLGISQANFPVTPKDHKPSVAEDVLVGMGLYEVPEVKMVIDYKQLSKGISSWLQPIEEYSRDDGLIHSRLAPFGTISYRMSSSDINMQGVPMKIKNKERPKAFGCFSGLFKARSSDESLWSIDIKQAEVRLAAMLAGSTGLAQALASGTDPYIEMSKSVWGTPNRRDDAKRATLASIYEIGPSSFSMKYGIGVDEASSILDVFRSRFPEVERETRRLENFSSVNKYVELSSGRKRWFDLDDDFYKAFNQRVQGTVAEVMDKVMLSVETLFPGRVVLQIHDSLIMELPNNEQERRAITDKVSDVVADSVPEWLRKNTHPEIPFLVDVEKW